MSNQQQYVMKWIEVIYLDAVILNKILQILALGDF